MVSESVTLAQIVRLVTLAKALDPQTYEVHFASSRFPTYAFEGTKFIRWPIDTLDGSIVEARVSRGERPYDVSTLERYVERDRELIDNVRPDLIIGDLRWSLSVSAPRASVPYAALANAYWSPHALLGRIPLPEHPIVRALGPRIAGACFPIVATHILAHCARPMNELRRRHGLPAIGGLRELVTHGDYTLFADAPELVPTLPLPPHQRFLGPVDWSPSGTLPAGWGDDPTRRPVYVTLGSSGDVRSLPHVLDGLAELGVDVLVASAGRVPLDLLPSGVRGVDFVPGDAAAAKAHLVVSNGGSSTGYQALAGGTPVLGIPYNLDQYLATAAITKTGAGLGLRSGSLTSRRVRDAAGRLLEDSSICERADALGRTLSGYDAPRAFVDFVEGALDAPERHRSA
jgi:UDP:flavonoid glycosyltransferase YjiC (YdhE family)